ncbi:MAG: tetratricopeptide repeat protein [Fuerstiella sp.]
MIRYRHGLLFAIVALSGCQTMSGLFQNRFASTPEYSTEEMLALSQPLPEATSPELGRGVVNAGASGQDTSAVSLASYNQANTPQQAGQSSAQGLVEAGQQAIRDAGQNNPAGLQQARALFQQALAADSNNADAHHGIAIVADLQKDWKAAEQHYKQALSGDASNPSLLNDLGYSYLLQSRYHESEQYLNQAIQISPQHERAHLNLALLSLRRGDVNTARQTLAKVYSQQEIGNNLARLQQDLMKLNAEHAGTAAGYPDHNSTMTVGLTQNGNSAFQQASQGQPSQWNANRPTAQNYGQSNSANPAYGNGGFANGGFANGGLANGGLANGGVTQGVPAGQGIQHFRDSGGTMAIDPALRVTESQPVSLYPPGVIREDVAAAQTAGNDLGFSQGQPKPQNGAQAIANAGYPNSQFSNVAYGNTASGGQPPFQAFPSGNMNGQMPTANHGSPMANSLPHANVQPSFNQLHGGQNGGMNSLNGYGAPTMGLNVGPGMPFPVGGPASVNPQQQGQYNPGAQNMAQPLLNQYDSGAMGMPSGGFGQANYDQAFPGQAFPGQAHGGQAHGGQGQGHQAHFPPAANSAMRNGYGQQEISQLPAHRQPLGEPTNGQFASGQMNTKSISYSQPVGSDAGMGQANYGPPHGMQNQVPGQFSGTLNQGGMSQPNSMNGQAVSPNAQAQPFGPGVNQGLGGMPQAGMPQSSMPQSSMPQTGMYNQFNGGVQSGNQGGPMQQFEQQQLSRINDQYQQALQQMGGRGFSGQ